ncbi:MAG: 3'-5' exonuclease, partial [Gammaproteobacteria bacterium]
NASDHALWVQYKLDQRIDHLLIDEFQDTNPTQWRLVLPLLEELAAGAQETLRSVFLVGDAKQSIYGFRRANPALQTEAGNWLRDHLQGQDFNLHASWRSSPAIIDFVNALFTATPLAGHIQDFEKHATHRTEDWGEVVLLPAETVPETEEPDPPEGLRNPLERPRPPALPTAYQQEAQRIASTLQAMIDGRTPVRAGDASRAMNYGDVIVLVPNRTHSEEIEHALRRASIPYLGAERGTLLESLEIEDLIALLNTLLTPFDDLAVAQVLRSPLFAASDEDLMLIARTSGHGWLAKLQRTAELSDAPPALSRAASLLERWRQLAGTLPIHDLLDRIFHEGDVVRRYEAAALPAQRGAVRANLTRFLELALEVDSGRYPSLVHFLARLRNLRGVNQEAPDTPPASTGEPRVRIMTIHAAKGLEAPVVFLANADGILRERATWDATVEWPADQERPRLMLLIPGSSRRDDCTRAILEQVRSQAERETANLLYVAVTRARQYLYLSAAGDPDKMRWYEWLREAMTQAGAEQIDDMLCLRRGEPLPTPAGGEPALTEKIDVPAALGRPLASTETEQALSPSQVAAGGHTGTEQDEDGLLRGQVIHRMLELLATNPSLNDAALASRMAAEFESPADGNAMATWIAEARAVIADPALGEVFAPDAQVRVYNEVPILSRQDKRLVRGVIDRLLVWPERCLIVDYKTHRIPSGGEFDTLAAGYRQQLMHYRIAVERLYPGRRIDTALLFTHSRHLYPIT